jgi:hypothetical protein
MKKITCVLAILAVASTAAVAKDLKQNQKATVPTVAATQMSNAEMDNVTAGVGIGTTTAHDHGGLAIARGLPGFELPTGPGATPGLGNCTAGRCN